ncbi:hypothetical protein IKF76_00170 [Candidatus Saccharibacteria bacterium]|nr:hypothetical protein [Candidatus Saccharibacteria bacterium]
MEIATWILVIFLSITLFVFLVVGIILIIKLIGFTNEAKKIVLTGQSIAEKADDVVDNVKDMTSVGGLVKTLVDRYNNDKGKKSKK